MSIDTRLLDDAVAIGHFDSQDAAINKALQEFVQRHSAPGQYQGDPKELIALFGTVDFDPDYDYKEARLRDLKRIPKDDDR